MKTCYIFGAAEGIPQKLKIDKSDLLIAADGGYKAVTNLGLTPDIILGDFDSLGFIPEFKGEIIKHPSVKDDTDTMLAIKTGIKRGFERFVLYGCSGNRLDHTLGNIQALSYIVNRSGFGFICGDGYCITAIKNSKLCFKSKKSGIISVFCLGETAEGVNINGLFYELNNAKIDNDFPLGISNEFVGKPAEIWVQKGILTVVWDGDFTDLD